MGVRPSRIYPPVFRLPGAEEPFDEAEDRVRGGGGEDAGDGQRQLVPGGVLICNSHRCRGVLKSVLFTDASICSSFVDALVRRGLLELVRLARRNKVDAAFFGFREMHDVVCCAPDCFATHSRRPMLYNYVFPQGGHPDAPVL